MALIFEKNDDNSPSTHALIIGVGGYRHLSGGVDEKQQNIKNVGLLKQLTSPPRSAVAFAEWIMKAADRLRAPLGTVDLLVSPAPDDPDPLPGSPVETWDITQNGVAQGVAAENGTMWPDRGVATAG
jgi:hypothetical protein